MIKILYVINYIENGGPSRVVMNLIRKIDKKRFDITLLTLKDKNNDTLIKELESEGICVKQLNYTSNSSIIKNVRTIIDNINSISPEIIHSHGLIPDLLVSTNRIKCYKITTIHNNMYEDYINSFGKIKGQLFIYIHQFCLKKIDRIVCCSKTSYNSIKKLNLNSCYIRNGIDIIKSTSYNDIRDKLGIPPNAVVYIYCGNLTYGKRILELINLLKDNMTPNEYFLILGRGPLYDEVVKYSSNNNNIKVLGFKNNIIDYFNSSDVYVSNSVSEGFSISVIEALGSGLYLLLSDISSHKECFEIDKNIYIGEFFNSKNFTNKKKELNSKMKNNKEIIRNFQMKNLSCKSFVEQYENEYKSGCCNES